MESKVSVEPPNDRIPSIAPNPTLLVDEPKRNIGGRGMSDNMDPLLEINMPEDAGEYADGLKAIMERIPSGWGRWIRCDKGWYPLIINLNDELTNIDPNYELCQVKEKFGGLRYYWDSGLMVCCNEWNRANPRPEPGLGGDENSPYKKWVRAQDEHYESKEHDFTYRKANADICLMEKIVYHYERLSFITCELCGGDGDMCTTKSGWYKTLCPDCVKNYNEAKFQLLKKDDVDVDGLC